MELLEAIKAIKTECDKHWDCESCVLHKVLCCNTYFPCNWHMDIIEEELKNDNQH